MEVIASDGVKDWDRRSPGWAWTKSSLPRARPLSGQHHYIPLTWVDHVDMTHVHLTKEASTLKPGPDGKPQAGATLLRDERLQAPFGGGPTMSLLEERATIDSRTVTTGKVSVVTHTETVEELVRAVLEGEEADVVTVELDQTVSGPAPRIRQRMESPSSRCLRKCSWWKSGSCLSAKSEFARGLLRRLLKFQ